jgi:hypothetical protein
VIRPPMGRMPHAGHFAPLDVHRPENPQRFNPVLVPPPETGIPRRRRLVWS